RRKATEHNQSEQSVSSSHRSSLVLTAQQIVRCRVVMAEHRDPALGQSRVRGSVRRGTGTLHTQSPNKPQQTGGILAWRRTNPVVFGLGHELALTPARHEIAFRTTVADAFIVSARRPSIVFAPSLMISSTAVEHRRTPRSPITKDRIRSICVCAASLMI